MLPLGLILGLTLLMSPDAGAAPPKAAKSGRPEATAGTASTAKSRGLQSYGNLPLRFELNRGQTDSQVKFLSRGSGYTTFLTASEAVLVLRSQESGVRSQNGKAETERRKTTQSFTMKFVGANPEAKVVGLDELPGKSNYFRGSDPRQWQTNVPSFSRVRYGGLYPGVDLLYYGNEGRLEYDFVVAPGADPNAIRFVLEAGNSDSDVGPLTPGPSPVGRGWPGGPGEGALRVEPNGDLVIATKGGEVRFLKPFVYQPKSSAGTVGNSESLDGRYKLLAGNQVRFEIPAYDKSKPLVIDPVLIYSTYLGGANGDVGYGVAVDADGNAYVTGSTGSTNFPTATPLQAATGGDFDIFVAKVNPTGTALVYSTYLGGAGFDRSTSIAVDSLGNAYLTGVTTSGNFPTTTGAFQTAFGGGTCGTTACSDAFVTKLNPAGSALVYSTYLGGSDSDSGQGIALDDSGNAYVTGSTLSTIFPTATPLQATGGGGADAFVTKVNPDGTGLVYSTYLGGTDGDFGQAIAVNAAGNAFVTGYTFSTNLPTINPYKAANAGSADVFVAELDAAGSALVYSTYFGGAGVDRAFALALDASGDAFITGDTVSSLDFPVTAGAYQTTFGGGTCGASPCSDAFIAELDPAGSSLLYSTFLGGSKNDSGSAIALVSTGQVFVTGNTFSDNFPILRPLQTAFGGGVCGANPCSDAFITALDPTGSTLVYSTFLGGNQTDFGQAIALDASSNAFVTGSTASPTFPATVGVIQVARGGTSPTGDAFLIKIGPADAPAVALSPQKLAFTDEATGFTSAEQMVTLTNSGSSALSISNIEAHGDFGVTGSTTCGTSVAEGGATCTIGVTFTPTTTGDKTGDVTITDDAGGSPHVIALTGKGVTPAPAATLDPLTLEFEDQTYNTTSAAQTITLTNSGTAALTITAIAISGDFAQTNTCPVTPATLAVAASCTFTVTFKPTSSGARTGTLTITDNGSNAVSGIHTASLKGTGIAVFTVSSTTTTTIVTRGTDSTTFTVKAEGPADFTSSITLACGSVGSASCAFNPTTIKVGETSTLTVSSLKQLTAASLAFIVTGTFETQVTSLDFTINFADFSLTPDPTFGTITSGDSKKFTLTLTPTYGFTGSASFTCANLPAESTCTFAPTTVTLDGTNTATVEVTVQTTVRTTANAPPRPGLPWPWVGAMLLLAGLMKLGLRKGRRAARTVLLAAVLLAMLFLSSCQENYYNFRGTLPGTYSVVFSGKVGDVTHSTFVSLTVN